MRTNKLVIGCITILMLASSASWAQRGKYGTGQDSVNCVTNLNFYKDYLKQGDYKEAASLWSAAFKYCPPTASQNMLLDGQKIMRFKLTQGNLTDEQKDRALDTLLMLSDIRAQYFPKYELKAKENKIFDMISYFRGDKMEIFNALNALIDEKGSKLDSDLLVAAMQTASKMYEAKTINDDVVLSTYSRISPLFAEKVKTDPSTKEQQQVFDAMFAMSGVANCDNLIKVFTPRYEANPNDKELVQMIARLLADSDCVQEELFFKTVTSLHQMDPSANSAQLLYKLSSSKDDIENAIKYLQEAIDSPDASDEEKGDMLFELASFYFKKGGNAGKAVSSAKLALEKKPSLSGKVNFLIGTIWMNTACGGNEIEKRAKYWVATDYFVKSKSDPELVSEADKYIGTARQYFPKAEDAFMYDLTDGMSFSISCGGMSAVTTVRTLK